MGDSSDRSVNLGDGNLVELTGKIMVVAIIVLLFVVVFVFCLHIYAKWWYSRRGNATNTGRRRRRRLDFAPGNQGRTVVSSGLDPSALKTIPVVLFDPEQFKEGLECAVCLSEVSAGEKTRLLPKCNHGFHVECIDMWFQSHATCPLCRNPVANPNSSASGETTVEGILQAPVGENPGEAPSIPTNVLYWGDETRVSTFEPCVEENLQGGEASSSSSSSAAVVASTSNMPEGALLIDIPRQANEEEEQKSPIPGRFRSLKRLLSGNRRVNPSSPRSSDIEQGNRGQT